MNTAQQWAPPPPLLHPAFSLLLYFSEKEKRKARIKVWICYMSEYKALYWFSIMRRRDMILLKQSVWIFNSAFYGSESGSQIGSWGTDSSKLLFSSKFSIVVTVFVILINSHCWKMWFWGFRFLISLIFGRKGPGTGFLCRFPLQQCQQPIWNYCISSTTTLCLGFYKDVAQFIADDGCTLIVFLGLWS